MNKDNRNRRRRLVTEFLGGDILKSNIVTKQLLLLFIILFMCLFIVGMRYRVEKYNRERLILQDKLSYIEVKRIFMQRQYQEAIRISHIDETLDSVGVGLVAGPPYELKLERKEK